MAKDPVCGMDVDERTARHKSVYQGQTYYFCSAGCKASFDKEPERYLTTRSSATPHGQHHTGGKSIGSGS